jgi:hypothetical protein
VNLDFFFFFSFFFFSICRGESLSLARILPTTEINFVRDGLGKVVSVQAHFEHIERRPRRREQRNADLRWSVATGWHHS